MERGSQAHRTSAAPAPARPVRPRRRRLGLILALMGLLAALARLSLIRAAVDVSPDGCEYLGIARHLVSERRWVSSLKWNFFTDAPVVHPALADRPPLFPLWAAAWVALSSHPQTQVWLARLGNLLLAAGVPALIFWALEPAVTEAAAALAALIFMLYPAFLRNSAQPLTEPLFLLLLFGSLGRFLRAGSPLAWSVSGLLAGLASLTRPSGILLPVLYSAALVTQSPVARRPSPEAASPSIGPSPGRSNPGHPPAGQSGDCWRPLLMVLLGFVLPLLPYWIAVAAQTGSPFSSILRYNYSIRHIDEGTFYGFERSFEPPVVFVWAHAGEIAGLVAGQWVIMGSALGRSLQYLLPLGLFWRRRAGWKQAVLLGFALLNFLVHALSWTVWGAARYLFPTYIIGMALLIDAPIRWETGRRGDERADEVNGGRAFDGNFAGSPCRPVALSPRLPVGPSLAAAAVALAVALTLIPCLEQDVRLYREKSRPDAGVHLGWAYAAAGDRLAETPPGSLCAANQPWIIHLLARRPAVIAPRFRDAAQLRRFLARYRPTTLSLFVTEREPKDVDTAGRLVADLWIRPSLRSELADALQLETAVLRAARAPRQALLIFRVRPTGGYDGRRASRPISTQYGAVPGNAAPPPHLRRAVQDDDRPLH